MTLFIGDKGRDEPLYHINVLDYGAIGDGVHDDTYAIRAAYDAARGKGISIVVFPPDRIYRIRGPL